MALAPFAYLLVLSTKKRIEIVAQVPPTLNINWDQIAKNYREVIDTQGMLQFVGNSIIVVGIATLIGAGHRHALRLRLLAAAVPRSRDMVVHDPQLPLHAARWPSPSPSS